MACGNADFKYAAKPFRMRGPHSSPRSHASKPNDEAPPSRIIPSRLGPPLNRRPRAMAMASDSDTRCQFAPSYEYGCHYGIVTVDYSRCGEMRPAIHHAIRLIVIPKRQRAGQYDLPVARNRLHWHCARTARCTRRVSTMQLHVTSRYDRRRRSSAKPPRANRLNVPGSGFVATPPSSMVYVPLPKPEPFQPVCGPGVPGPA